MDLFLYSDVLSVLSVLIFLFSLLYCVLFLFQRDVTFGLKDFILEHTYKIVALLAGLATIFALIYQYIYLTPVCDLCWWQRIFMFPIEAIIIWALVFNIKKVEWLTLFLSLFGGAVAMYHYVNHFKVFVLGKAVDLGCDAIGLTPSCSDSPILSFGYVTIPLMAFFIFSSIFILSAIKILNK